MDRKLAPFRTGLALIVAMSCVAVHAQVGPEEPPAPPASEEQPSSHAEPAEEAPPIRADLGEPSDRIREQDYAGAIELLTALREEYPEDPALLLMLGECLLAERRPAEARPVLERSAELDPARERVHFQLASALAMTGEVERAIEALGQELGITDDPEIVRRARLNRALLFQNTRRWQEAAVEFESILELEPDRLEIYGDLATSYLQAGDTAAAADALRRGEEHGFASAVHQYSLGARLYRDKRIDDAIAAFRRALEIDPERAEAELSLAAALEKSGRNEEAILHFRRYLELRPDAKDRDKILARIEAAGG